MTDSLRVLMTGLIDYAGLFPPAKLGMAEAVANYARYRTCPLSWMLSRFICPVSRLEEFEAVAPLTDPAHPWKLSALGTGGADSEQFLDALAADLDALEASWERTRGAADADALEVRFPETLHQQASHAQLTDFLRGAGARLDGAGHAPGSIFFELPFVEDWPERHRLVAAALSRVNEDGPTVFGLKIRTGGVTPEAVPHPDAVAGFLLEARDAGVPFKATAGLHHPLRHPDPGLGVPMHGFFNVFIGAALLRQRVIESESLRDLIRDEDTTAFRFTDAGLSWRELALDTATLREIRDTFAVSFGSCSFEEPWEDLHALGLLDVPPPATSPS